MHRQAHYRKGGGHQINYLLVPCPVQSIQVISLVPLPPQYEHLTGGVPPVPWHVPQVIKVDPTVILPVPLQVRQPLVDVTVVPLPLQVVHCIVVLPVPEQLRHVCG